jgi:hypothetical protein
MKFYSVFLILNPSRAKAFLPTHKAKGGGNFTPPLGVDITTFLNNHYIFSTYSITNEEERHKNEVCKLYTLCVVIF